MTRAAELKTNMKKKKTDGKGRNTMEQLPFPHERGEQLGRKTD